MSQMIYLMQYLFCWVL